MKKIVLMILCLGILYFPSATFADTGSGDASMPDETLAISGIAQSFLNIIFWFAFAILIGILLFIGIKYMLGTAQEKSNLKSIFPKYIIGLILIMFCFGIAKWFAEVAGNDPAEEIINVGEENGDQFAPEECIHVFRRGKIYR